MRDILTEPLQLYYLNSQGLIKQPDRSTLSLFGSAALALPCQQEEVLQAGHTPIFLCQSCRSTQEFLPLLRQRYTLSAGASLLSLNQEHGRGQFGRRWVSPPGNLYVTALLPDLTTSTPPPLLLGAATVLALRENGQPGLWLKWPNDLVMQQQGSWLKVGGMLLEDLGQQLLWGMGLNLRSAPTLVEAGHLPAGILPQPLDSPLEVWLAIYPQVCRTIQTWLTQPQKNLIHEKVEPLLALRGQKVCFRSHQSSAGWQSGYFLGLTQEGTALLALENGEQMVLHSGSLRPKED